MLLLKRAEVNALYDTYITEAEGTQGTMKLGKGPVYKEKRDKARCPAKRTSTIKRQQYYKNRTERNDSY